ncbi:hypothetical protein G3T14_12665 [Methylobacterium sp. BTF04]|nr:hypothetical protein [Methylobacterium sp. BTF04]
MADHRFRTIRLTGLAIALSLATTAPGSAQETPFIDVAHGTMLIHGNYCGPGNRSPRPPVDALDEACMHHDACSPARGELPTCSCNARLHSEAETVAKSPRYAQSLRDTAGFVADAALAMPCH